ncbi:MAG: copper resistance protein CopC [Tetrasphaera sp.]|nr:copper resistance protein CopC [Tetrasphaera sp.]
MTRGLLRVVSVFALSVLAVLAGFAGFAGFAGESASAHSALVSSTPADGATLASSPPVAQFVFNEKIQPNFLQVALTGPAGALTLVPPTAEGATVTQKLPELAAGTYRTAYRVVSADGHPISGTISFTVKATPSPSPTVTASPRPTPTPTPSATPTPTASSAPSTEPASAGSRTLEYALIASVLGLTLAGVARLTRRRPPRR